MGIKTDYRPGNDQDGFVLVLALLILIVLLIVGITAMKGSKMELYIAGNERQTKQIFYSAESGAFQAAQLIKNDTANSLHSWSTPGLNSDSTMQGVDMALDATWDSTNSTISSGNSTLINTKFISIDKGVGSGGSLDMATSQLHDFDIYGRTKYVNAKKIINIGFKRRF